MSEERVRAHVLALNLGRCALCPAPATNYAHRLPAGQGGPVIIPNGLPLCGSGTTGCHGASEQRRALSYACGWLIRDPGPIHGRSARIAAVPALIRTPLGVDWHILDFLDDDGAPAGMARLAEPDEIPAGMWPHGYAAAVRALRAPARAA